MVWFINKVEVDNIVVIIKDVIGIKILFKILLEFDKLLIFNIVVSVRWIFVKNKNYIKGMFKNFNFLGRILDWFMIEVIGKNVVISKFINVFIGILKIWLELFKLNKFFKV